MTFQSLKRLIYTKRFNYIVLAIVFSLVAILDGYFAFYGNDLALRFLPTIASILFTIVFLGILFDFREALQWRTVEKQVMKRIRGELHLTFFLSKRFIDLSEIGYKPSESLEWAMKSEQTELEALASLSVDQLSRDSLEAFKAGDDSKLADYEFHLSNEGIQLLYDGTYNGQFDLRRQFLNDMETKYAKFLNPEIVMSLLEIQNCLQHISINAGTFTKIKGQENQKFIERFLSVDTANRMHVMIVQIKKIADSIGFYPY